MSVPCQEPPPPEKETVDKQEKQDQSAMAAYTDFDSEEGDSACKYGIEMWKAAKDKVKKYPFVHAAFLKKGEEVNSFEMLVHFKTTVVRDEVRCKWAGKAWFGNV